ncbi:MAG: NUDIX domain-containing protein [Saprospiraceae bacterium]|nr:NUDIX domain-containing protein [Saprospiraceae bacterium]
MRALERDGYLPEGQNFQFGRFLYNKYHELQKNPGAQQVMVRDEEYVQLLCKYLGCNSLEDFVRKCEKEEVLRWPPEWMPQNGDGFTYYIGTYFSFRSYRVNKFLLGIRPIKEHGAPVDCWVWGFHTNEQMHDAGFTPDEPVNSPVLKGDAVVLGRYLHVRVNADPAEAREVAYPLQMNLIGICEDVMGRFSLTQSVIPCTLQTVSLFGYLIALEAYLLRCTTEEARALKADPVTYRSPHLGVAAITQEQERCLHLYYMLQRRNFRVKLAPNVFRLRDLEYRGNRVLRYANMLAGTYRVWNLGLKRGVVIQSKLVISEETPFRALFYPYLPQETVHFEDLEEQLAVMTLSHEVRPHHLSFTTYARSRLTLVSMAIFDIQEMGSRGWAEGMFISTGYDSKGIVGGYAVMCRVKKGEACEPRRMEREEAERYAQDLGIADMYKGLRQLWKRKLWKPKTNTRLGCYGVLRRPDSGAILTVFRTEGPYSGALDLPGGLVEFGETPEMALRRLFERETGLRVRDIQLLGNESHQQIWRRKDGIEENMHHIGLIYQVAVDDWEGDLPFPYLHWTGAGTPAAQLSPFAARVLYGPVASE